MIFNTCICNRCSCFQYIAGILKKIKHFFSSAITQNAESCKMYTKTVKGLQCFILLDLIFLNSEAQGGTSSPNFMSPRFFSSSNTVSFYKTIAMWTSAWRRPGLQETAFTKTKHQEM